MVLLNQPLKLLKFLASELIIFTMIITDCSNNRPDYEYDRLFGTALLWLLG